MLTPDSKKKSGNLDKKKCLQCVGETMAVLSFDFAAPSLL